MMEIVFLGTRAADLDPVEIERQAGAAFLSLIHISEPTRH